MGWLWNHLVLVAGLVAIAAVLVGAAVVVAVALRAWRRTKRTVGRAREAAATMERSIAAVEARARALEARQEEVATALAGLDAEVRVARLLVAHVGRAVGVLRAPLRYVGR